MKSILVMEMPDNCVECDFCDYGGCRIKSTIGITVLPQKARPYLCPLKPLPERRRIEAVSSEYEDGVTAGWNACIDAIEGMAK